MKSALLVLRGIGIISAILIVILVSQLFFQQDEWHSFGVILGYGKTYLTLGKSVFQLLLSDRFGSRLVTYGLFSVFGANAVPFGILAGGLHVLNSYLVYLLAHKLTRSTLAALLSSLLFLVNAVSHQAYSWFGTVAGSATSVTFIILSMILYVEFIQRNSKTAGWFSILALWASFLFKETGYFLFLWYPILWLFLRSKKFSFTMFIKDHLPLGLLGLLMTSLFIKAIFTIPGDRANYVAPNTGGLVQAGTNFLRYSFEGSVQVFIPPPVIFEAAKFITNRFVPWLEPNTPLLVWIYKTAFTSAAKPVSQTFFASLLYLPLSFLPYAVLNRFDAYLDSRYYYAPAVGAALLFGIITGTLIHRVKLYRTTMIIALIVLAMHAITLFTDLATQIHTSGGRRNILATIRSSVLELPPKAIFFVSGNSDGFYALPELKVPFQSGLGHVLMVLYAGDNQLPKEFFVESTLNQALDVGFLYDTIAQGYKEVGTRGFGYFYDKDAMQQVLDANQDKDIEVFSFYYDAQARQLRRISL